MDLISKKCLEITKDIIPKIFNYLSRINYDTGETHTRIETHLSYISKWSQIIQFCGMVAYKNTYEDTIRLQLNIVPRRFRGQNAKIARIDEDTIISDSYNYLILGDPGAGKTTTLKRLATKILLEKPLACDKKFKLPILVLLKELDNSNSLIEKLADIFGIKFCYKETIVREEINYDDSIAKIKKKLKHNEQIEYDANGFPRYILRKKIKRYVGDTLLDKVLGDLISISNAIILLDGLDEVSSNLSSDIVEDVESICNYISDSKIIISCRSGDYKYINGFNIIEICPLDEVEKLEIIKKWSSDPDSFIKALSNVPYLDLSDKPLFLTNLIILFNNRGNLPEQPFVVYKNIVTLMLEFWDQQRKIKRLSSYAGFSIERKIEFLSSLSYHLTYEIKQKVFSETDLLNSYKSIHENFRLPRDQANLVIGEIESHTGLIVQNGENLYAFSHLSIQEYLCAYYIVRASFSLRIKEYIKGYPAPIAIAVCISSNSTDWFQKIILDEGELHFNSDSMVSFLSRLILEKPYFTRSTFLGLAFLKICFCFPEGTEKYMLKLLEDPFIRDSVVDAISYYSHVEHRDKEEEWYFSAGPALNFLKCGHPKLDGYLRKSIANLHGHRLCLGDGDK
jgi:hypothetical protein